MTELPTRFTRRDAVESDLPAIVEIYNQSVPGGWSTADTRAITVESRRAWFAQFDPKRRPIWVAESHGEVAGWVCLSSFYAGRPAYDATAEISLYIANAFQKRGLGRALKKVMIDACPKFGVTTLLSLYFDHNAATAKLNAELGFSEVGYMPEIAVVFGQPRGLKIGLLRVG